MTDRTLGLISTAFIALGLCATAYATAYSIPRVVMTIAEVSQ